MKEFDQGLRRTENEMVQNKCTPTLYEAREFAKAGYEVIPVYRTILADLETPVSAFLKFSESGSPFILESVEGGEDVARFSYVGVNYRRALVFPTSGGQIDQYPSGEKKLSDEGKMVDPMKVIKSLMPPDGSVAPVSGMPGFGGGFVGYEGSECYSRRESTVPTHPDTLGIPDAIFFETGELMVFDRKSPTIKILTNIRVEGKPEEIDTMYSDASSRIEDAVLQLRKPLDPKYSNSKKPKVLSNEIKSNFSPLEYEEAVKGVKEHLSAGDAFQVVLSQRLARQTNAEGITIYRYLRSTNPSPYTFLMDFTGLLDDPQKIFQVIGASPELVIDVAGKKLVHHPLAGTRLRGEDEGEDKALEVELLADPKDRAEHVMLVDLERNDLGRVAKYGSVKVTDLMSVVRFSRVMHMVSTVEAELADGKTCFEAITACNPVGTVSGAPKVEAMKIINKFEPTRRGIYSGGVGYISYCGDAKIAIAIRTLVKLGKEVINQAGGGIVMDSDPASERQETLNKASAGFRAVELAEKHEL